MIFQRLIGAVLSFWVSLGVVGGLVFQRWVCPALLVVLECAGAGAGAESPVNATQ